MLKTSKIQSVNKSDNGYKYYRLYPVDASGNKTVSENLMLFDWILNTDIDLTGIEYPTTNLTSDTSEPGITVSAGYYYNDSYLPYKAFDQNKTSTGWWALTVNNSDNHWLEIMFDNEIAFKSMSFNINTGSNTMRFKIFASNTGNFSGEEVLLYHKDNTLSSITINL